MAACVGNAKMQMGMLYLLLTDGAKRAQQIIDAFVPRFGKDEYLAFMDSLCSSGDRIEYDESGIAKVNIR